MFDARRLSENIWVRYFVYFIVFGMVLLMGFSVISFGDLTGNSKADYITVNGQDVFLKEIPSVDPANPSSFQVYNVFKSYINQQGQTKGLKAALLYQMVQDWDKPHVNRNLEYIRQALNLAIIFQLNKELAEDLNVVITDKDLKDYIGSSFEQYLKAVYEAQKKENKSFNLSLAEYKDENRDYIWKEYSGWAGKHLKDIYINNIFLSAINNGVLPTFADMDMKYQNQEHKVQVDFGLYTFEHYLDDPAFLNSLDQEELKKYYTETEEKITAEQVVYTSLEKANDAKRDPDLFKPAKENEKKTVDSKIVTFQSKDDFFKDLINYPTGSTTDVIQGKKEDKQYYIFKIINKSTPYEGLKADKTSYKEFLKKYANQNYTKIKDNYEKRAEEVMNKFLQVAQSGRVFTGINSIDPMIRNVKVGRTDFFNQVPLEVQLLQKKGKDGKEPKPIEIPEFLEMSYITGERFYNKEFFKTAFSLKKGELSPKVHSEVLENGNKKVFFVLKNVDIKKPDMSKPIPFGVKNRYFITAKNSDGAVISNNWAKYIMDKYGYEVKVNPAAILAALGVQLPEYLPKEKK